MHLLLSALSGLGIIAASLIAGWLAARLFLAIGRGIHHPAWGLALALLLIPLACLVPAGGVIRMTILFTLISAGLLWLTADESRTA